MNGGSVDMPDQELVRWLRAQPEGLKIEWYNDHINDYVLAHPDTPLTECLCFGWVDVHVDVIEEALGWSWAWTIVAEREGHDPSDEIVVKPDTIDDDQGPGWLPATIEKAVIDWCKTHAGVDVELTWAHDHGPSEFFAAAIAMKQAILDGELETYTIKLGEAEGGEGLSVKVPGPMMDQLMAMPKELQLEIMQAVNEITAEAEGE